MSVQPKDLKRIARSFLNIMERADVISLLDLEGVSEKTFPIEGKTNEYVSVSFTPSSNQIRAYTKSPTLSYIIEGTGIPLEVKINSFEGYSKIIVKTQISIPDYYPFAVDRYGNIVQNKKIDSTDISEVRKELEKLIS